MMLRALVSGLGLAAAATVVAAGAPALAASAPVRRALMSPRLSGMSTTPHIALTFDGGPDPRSTPDFLDLLAEHGRHATFFVLGAQAAAHPEIMRRMIAEGHEVAVHGWTHRPPALMAPTRLIGELRAAVHEVQDITGTAVHWYRPPYGVLSIEAFVGCRKLGLEPVLWTASGREWERAAMPQHIVDTIMRDLRQGGTIVLHDTDLHAPRGDWHITLAATAALLSGPLANTAVGPLDEHW